MSFRRGISQIINHPLGRGMISYSITWPTAAFIQEILDKKKIGEYVYYGDYRKNVNRQSARLIEIV